MATVLVTYDLKQPGRDYKPVHDYLRKYTHCKQMESVWLLDTPSECLNIRDDLIGLVDQNDVVFVVRIKRDWAGLRYGCGSWLNEDPRTW